MDLLLLSFISGPKVSSAPVGTRPQSRRHQHTTGQDGSDQPEPGQRQAERGQHQGRRDGEGGRGRKGVLGQGSGGCKGAAACLKCRGCKVDQGKGGPEG